MRSPALVIINDSHLFVSGEVVIHPSAAIASGVLLQADPGCRLIVNAGVCVGSGSILHANQGDLVIEAGAILGSGVLLVGSCTIGEAACVGSLTTILGCSIAPRQFVPAESLLGDRSRQTEPIAPQAHSEVNSQSHSQTHAQTYSQTPYQPEPPIAPNGSSPAQRNGQFEELESPWTTANGSNGGSANPADRAAAGDDRASADAAHSGNSQSWQNGATSKPPESKIPESAPQPAPQVVYGRAYLEKMMIRMFPQQTIDPTQETD